MNPEDPKKSLVRCLVPTMLAFGAASAVHAQARIDSAWVRATVPNPSATGAFMRLTAQKDQVLTRRQVKAGESAPLTLTFKATDGTLSPVELRAMAGFTPPAQ